MFFEFIWNCIGTAIYTALGWFFILVFSAVLSVIISVIIFCINMGWSTFIEWLNREE